MKIILLAILAGVIIIATGSYFAYQSFKQSFLDAINCRQLQDVSKLIDGCSHVIDSAKSTGPIYIRIQGIDLHDAYLNRGYGYIKLKHYDEARKDLNEAIRINPNLAMAYNDLGAIDINVDDLKNADENLDHAIDIDSKLGLAWDNRCKVRVKSGRYSEAVNVCTHAIELDERNADNYLSRGVSYTHLGEDIQASEDKLTWQKHYNDALADFDYVIKLSPSNAVGHNNRCHVLVMTAAYADAIASCETAIKLDANYAAPHVNRGEALLSQNDATQAIADFDTAIRLDPKMLDAYGDRSSAFRRTGDFSKAFENSQAFVAQFPGNASALSDRAINRFALGDFRDAAGDFTLALQKEGWVYRSLWRYLSLMRAGEDGTSKLSDDLKKLKDKNWPYPVIEFYLGQRKSDDMLAAAADDDQRCEAAFYLGEWQLLQHNVSDAAPLLRKTIDTCPKSFIEYAFAQAELKRLTQ